MPPVSPFPRPSFMSSRTSWPALTRSCATSECWLSSTADVNPSTAKTPVPPANAHPLHPPAHNNLPPFWLPKPQCSRVGTPVSSDVVVFEEPDESFYVGVGRDFSDKVLYIQSGGSRCDVDAGVGAVTVVVGVQLGAGRGLRPEGGGLEWRWAAGSDGRGCTRGRGKKHHYSTACPPLMPPSRPTQALPSPVRLGTFTRTTLMASSRSSCRAPRWGRWCEPRGVNSGLWRQRAAVETERGIRGRPQAGQACPTATNITPAPVLCSLSHACPAAHSIPAPLPSVTTRRPCLRSTCVPERGVLCVPPPRLRQGPGLVRWCSPVLLVYPAFPTSLPSWPSAEGQPEASQTVRAIMECSRGRAESGRAI
jgi:hypothetical protein